MQIIKNTNQQLIKKIPGNYYTDLLCGASTGISSGAILNNALNYYAIIIPESLLISEIAFRQTTTAAGVSFKMNLYDSYPDTLLPRNKLLTDTIVSADNLGIKSLPVNRVLKGLYFVGVIRSGGGSPSCVTKANTLQVSQIFNLNGATGGDTAPSLGTRKNLHVYADIFPDPAIQNETITYVNSAILMLWYKI
jgi:hypothetical protein